MLEERTKVVGPWATPVHNEDVEETEEAVAAAQAAACRVEWTRRAWAMAIVDNEVVLECTTKLIWLSESADVSKVDTALRRMLEGQVLD